VCTEGAVTVKEERNGGKKNPIFFCLSTYREAHAKSHGEPPPFSCTSFPTLPLLRSKPILSQNESEMKPFCPDLKQTIFLRFITLQLFCGYKLWYMWWFPMINALYFYIILLLLVVVVVAAVVLQNTVTITTTTTTTNNNNNIVKGLSSCISSSWWQATFITQKQGHHHVNSQPDGQKNKIPRPLRSLRFTTVSTGSYRKPCPEPRKFSLHSHTAIWLTLLL
jgi:hypothetical protein